LSACQDGLEEYHRDLTEELSDEDEEQEEGQDESSAEEEEESETEEESDLYSDKEARETRLAVVCTQTGCHYGLEMKEDNQNHQG